MNYWTQLSIDFASQRNYLDELFSVYPLRPEGMRDIDEEVWAQVEQSFTDRDNAALVRALLKLDLFPIKDSYVAFLRKDQSSIDRNPNTIDRLCGRFYEMGLDKIYDRSSEPKETNRQIGPLLRRWLNTGALGVQPISLEDFLASDGNAVLDASDAQITDFAKERLNYTRDTRDTRDKGLDFLARFNGKYVIGEAKFLTDTGGNQNNQFYDAINVFQPDVDAVTVAILDGVLYIKSRSKMYRAITQDLIQHNIMSALVLREFLYQL